MKRVSRSLSETEEIAKEFLHLSTDSRQAAQIVGLSGDLGSGKTTFVQAVARILGVKETLTSPTFVIMKIYELAVKPLTGMSGFTANSALIHIDAYRLQDGDELMKLGFGEIAKDPKNLILIEWPENIASALPKEYQKVFFKFFDENTREIDF